MLLYFSFLLFLFLARFSFLHIFSLENTFISFSVYLFSLSSSFWISHFTLFLLFPVFFFWFLNLFSFSLPLPLSFYRHLSFFFVIWTFFSFLRIYLFDWRVITLQYCDGFCHTSVWISHRYTRVPPNPEPPSLLPILLSIGSWVWICQSLLCSVFSKLL